ncbi:MAG: hypothetical protein J6A35_05655 [Paludibacteraceae bacterium]|nr:hypothetical protein [Paludibacteraceae bacterium]
MLDSFMHGLVPIFGVLLLFGGIPGIILTGVIMYLKNRRHKVEEHSKLISQMIDKSEASNLDFKAMAEMLNESESKKKTKKSVLKQLNAGVFLGVLGLFILIAGIALGKGEDAILTGAFLLTAGIAFVIMFFVSKNYLKKEIEKEEKALAEKE